MVFDAPPPGPSSSHAYRLIRPRSSSIGHTRAALILRYCTTIKEAAASANVAAGTVLSRTIGEGTAWQNGPSPRCVLRIFCLCRAIWRPSL